MALTHRYTLLCDDARQESNGKFIIIGLYTPDIVVPVVPFALPSLTLFSAIESDRAEEIGFNFRLLAAGDTLLAGGSGKMRASRGMGVIPLRFGALQFPNAGNYRFILELEGAEPLTHEFRVVLNQQFGPTPVTGTGVH